MVPTIVFHREKFGILQKWSFTRGSEWGYLDNTKHLIFWLCNMKQLNFRQFNTNSKKFIVTVNFTQKETKAAPKRPILFCLVVRRLSNISEEKYEKFRLYFCRYFHRVKGICFTV